ncbi:hypothetical protein [Trueperella bernardiae]|uniref:hypothetical protein n=1 Tax=Trueperella bernardiae TaxID=59561 RepID=UPI00083809AC|nr:hypothetical protein [Trueperella bernardiae]OCW59795.1 hypothetical protein AKG36_08480 [Trueperella bernardiae]
MNTAVTAICADLPALYRHMLDLTTPTIQAIRYTAAHTTGTQADSLPERATYARERLEHELGTLREIASILADTDHGQAPIDKVASVLAEHATTLAAWPDLLADVDCIHARWKKMVAPDTETSGHLCPACGTTTLHWHHNDRLYRCPACDYAGTAGHVANLRTYTITQADVWVDRSMACVLFGLTREGLKKHIQRGNICPREGLFSTVELRALPRRGEILLP